MNIPNKDAFSRMGMKVVQKHESLILDWQDGLHATLECGYGDGYGTGHGYGYGDGDGNGNGYGYGYGYGDGNGYGNGFGNGIEAIV